MNYAKVSYLLITSWLKFYLPPIVSDI